MDTMGIAALSVSLHASQLNQDRTLAVMKMAMDDQTKAMSTMLESISTADINGIGEMIDILA